ncbi:hypothetical protein ACQRIU_005226 [Beauveria bassiana]
MIDIISEHSVFNGHPGIAALRSTLPRLMNKRISPAPQPEAASSQLSGYLIGC